MKQILILLLFIIALSCKEDPKNVVIQEANETVATISNNDTKTVTETATIAFLEDVKNLEKETSNNPIENFKKTAATSVKEIIKLNKDNIKTALAKAKNYKHAVVIVENHTIVKITDLDNCKTSGSWSACMPKGEGYIKKGALVYKNDYINNIIGLPNSQERLLYLF